MLSILAWILYQLDIMYILVKPYTKEALRAQGRRAIMKASPMFSKVAAKMGKALEVHHIIPLEWAHLMGKDFNPNVIDNLVGVKDVIHYKITKKWLNFKLLVIDETVFQQRKLYDCWQ
jgi:hypothetical protein